MLRSEIEKHVYILEESMVDIFLAESAKANHALFHKLKIPFSMNLKTEIFYINFFF